MQKAVFFDRDGVLNVDRGTYTYRIDDFEIVNHVKVVLSELKGKGYQLIVVTNQAGIAKGLYKMEDVEKCHKFLQERTGRLIDDFYVAPDHPDYSKSLSRKPDSLLFEKAIAKHDISPQHSWMIGDRERDLIPAKKLGIATILLSQTSSEYADFRVSELNQCLDLIG